MKFELEEQSARIGKLHRSLCPGERIRVRASVNQSVLPEVKS